MASMVARMAESLTSPWKQFQERQPMGGVSASPGTGGAAAPATRRAAKVVLAAPFFAKPQRDTKVRGMLQDRSQCQLAE